MERVPQNSVSQLNETRQRLRDISHELNDATAELSRACQEVFYRRVRLFPLRHGIPAWGASLIVGGIGASAGAIPVLLVQGDNLPFIFIAVCAAYTILTPATLILLADRDGETDDSRRESREGLLFNAIARRAVLQQRIADLHRQHYTTCRTLEEIKRADHADR